MFVTKKAFAAPLIAVTLLLVLAAAAQAKMIAANVHDDPATSGDCQTTDLSCSLRQAITTAQPGDVIQLDGSADTPVTYSLTQGDIVMSQDVTVEGNGVDATIIDGSGNSARILRIDNGTVTIQHLSIINGVDANDENCASGCSTINANGGGSIFHDGGTLALNDVAFRAEPTSANPLGGAISNGFGTLTMTDVSFTNESAGIGGALFVRNGNVSGVGVTFENDGTVDEFDGGAAYLLGGSLSLTNATIVGNGTASSIGGGIANGGGTLTLVDDTFSGNSRGAIQTDQGATTIVTNTIIGAGFSDGSDFACLPSGRWHDSLTGAPVGPAITNDDGNNLDEDGHCGFSGNGDIIGADAHLASIADNGGPTRTQALLGGSPAIGNGNPAHCLPNDQRDINRDGLCDIGAFQTHTTSAPATPSTSEAGSITDSSGDLHGTINLSGDAGGFHFIWGTDSSDLSNSTSVQGVGVVSDDTLVDQTLGGLNPGTEYFYKIVADNSTGSATADNVQSFTTQADPPSVFNVSRDSVTDTTANLSFTINPNGADTSYVIQYGDGDPGNDQSTDPVDIGAAAGDQQLTATLHNLDPGSDYHYKVIATNDPGSNDSGDQQFNTAQQVAGTARLPVDLDDGGPSFSGCPTTAKIDWGDGTALAHATPVCLFPGDEEEPAEFDLTADHIYARPGHYEIDITYTDIEQTSTQYAQISENDVTPPSNTALPAISGSASPGKSLTCSQGSWSNGPTDFAFAWSRDGNPISAATAQTYAVQSADQGHTLTCTVTASNDGGSSDPATSHGLAVAPPTGPGGPPSTTSKPTPNKPTSSTQSPTSAAFQGAVNPGGLATTAHFEYGLDSKYTNPGTSGPVYDQSTPSQNIGSGASNQPVTASVTGLVPNALYHVRLVATNSAGTTLGPDTTFTTPPAPAPGAPTVTKSFDVKPTQGVVLVALNGKLVPVTQLKQIPSGAVIDALHGTLNLVTAIGHKTQTGTFGGAIFKVTQDHSGLTTLTLVENAFKGAPSYASCKAPSGKASAAALSKKVLQLLHAKDNHGKFRTKGRYAAATTRGTVWTIADRCDGTLTHVTKDSVLINDLVRRIRLVLHAGHSYLALAKPPRHK